MNEKALEQRRNEERLRQWLFSCPGYVVAANREALFEQMRVSAQLPHGWTDFEAALDRCGYRIEELSGGRFCCRLPGE